MTDLRKLSKSETTRLLNGTPLGKVVGVKLVDKHLQRAGTKISDAKGKKINFLKYVAWLSNEHATKKDFSAKSYDEIKEKARLRAAIVSESGRDIGKIPEVVNLERKNACKNNLQLFLESYFFEKFSLSWSKMHLEMIKDIEYFVLNGGLKAIAMPRGTGKTTIGELAMLWAASYGHRKFIVIIGASEDASFQILHEIKTEIECNETYFHDFPEISYPIRCLEGITNRANGQTCNGERTRIKWSSKDSISLPVVHESLASGVTIKVKGITGQIRGMKTAMPGSGESLRPDFVFVDDPQTDESAASPEQNKKRIRILDGTILGLAGPGKKIAGIMPCTVIRPEDMADQILDQETHPEWNGKRYKLLESMPKNIEMWDKYAEIWADSLRDTKTIKKATEFYCNNKKKMDDGAIVSWPDRYEEDEESAIQNAMNIYIRNKETFYAEYQNEPMPEDLGESEKMDIELIKQRLNNRPRYQIPVQASKLTMFIDVQKNLLFYVICAFDDNFNSWIIDYGVFPDQKRRYFTLNDARKTLSAEFPDAGFEGSIYGGLKKLTDDLLAREFKREDGAIMRIERCLIDSAWGNSTNTVYLFCRESAHAAILLPSRGDGVTASRKPINEYNKKQGDRIGNNWWIPGGTRRRSARLLIYDTNFWKTFFSQRVFTALGDAGSFSIFGKDFEQHRMLAEQLTSEYATPTAGRDRQVDVWKLFPGRDNHFLDCVVGCMVAASEQGIVFMNDQNKLEAKFVSFKEMQKNKIK